MGGRSPPMNDSEFPDEICLHKNGKIGYGFVLGSIFDAVKYIRADIVESIEKAATEAERKRVVEILDKGFYYIINGDGFVIPRIGVKVRLDKVKQAIANRPEGE
jgi:hypothetical protein